MSADEWTLEYAAKGFTSMNRWMLSLAILIVLTSLTWAQNADEENPIQAVGSARIENTAPDPTPAGPLALSNGGITSHMIVQTMRATATKKKMEEDRFFEFDKRPHLLLLPTLNLNGGGFQPVSVAIGGGFSFEPKYIIAEGLASYNAARKTNDGTENNTKGHIRELDGSLFFRAPKYWFLGTDARWVQLSTTNYMKESWRMSFGGGRDFVISNFSTRIKVTYALPNFDHVNGVQGVNITFYVPSPIEQKRFAYYEQMGIMALHATITDPSDPVLTAKEKASRSYAGSCIFGVRMRF